LDVLRVVVLVVVVVMSPVSVVDFGGILVVYSFIVLIIIMV
jgi:hypothetical protein